MQRGNAPFRVTVRRIMLCLSHSVTRGKRVAAGVLRIWSIPSFFDSTYKLDKA
jgi:hypothetical protein